MHLLISLLSIRVGKISPSRRLFACRGDFSAKPLPPVVEIHHNAFAERCSVLSVPQVEHLTHLGGKSPPNWNTIPYKRVGKTAGSDYLDLASWGLTFVLLDCAS